MGRVRQRGRGAYNVPSQAGVLEAGRPSKLPRPGELVQCARPLSTLRAASPVLPETVIGILGNHLTNTINA